MDFSQVRSVVSDLERNRMARDAGMVAVISASLIISAIPLVGGPGSYMIDKAGTKMFEPDFAKHIVALSNAILAIEPALARIDELEDGIARIDAIMRSHPELDGHIRPVIEAGAMAALDTMELRNRGGIQNVVDVILRDLHLEATTDGGGVSDFRGIDHVGTARFAVEPGSTQTITGSSFTGRTGPVMSQVAYNGTSTNHGVTQEYNMTRNGTTIAKRTVMETKAGESRAGMTISRNGIEYGKKVDR